MSVSPNPIPRGGTATFTVQNATGGVMSNWSFTTANYPTVTRTTNTGSGTWAGTIVAEGTGHVTVVLNGTTYNLSAAINVTPRSWQWTNLPPTQVTNGTIFNLPSPPFAGSAEGYSLLDLRFSFATTTVSDNGPNQGFQYVSSLMSSSQGINSSYRYEIVPDVEQNNGTFYRAQCGNYNASTNTGFIDGPVLRSNVQQHEYGTILGHYQQYVAAQIVPSNNIGLIAEPQLGGPGTATDTFVSSVQQSLNVAQNTVLNAMVVEACNSDVRNDTSCTFRGFINFAPYQSCR